MRYVLLLLLLTACADTMPEISEQEILSSDIDPYTVNVYNEPLQPCGDESQGRGSWDPNYYCNEPGGGVHQICFREIGETADRFSLTTGQSDWSTARANNNHCVCLGAYANYAAKRNQNNLSDAWTLGNVQLNCHAIPKASLSEVYTANWMVWNGEEQYVQDQIVEGVNEMYVQCVINANEQQAMALKENYCAYAQTLNTVRETGLFQELC